MRADTSAETARGGARIAIVTPRVSPVRQLLHVVLGRQSWCRPAFRWGRNEWHVPLSNGVRSYGDVSTDRSLTVAALMGAKGPALRGARNTRSYWRLRSKEDGDAGNPEQSEGHIGQARASRSGSGHNFASWPTGQQEGVRHEPGTEEAQMSHSHTSEYQIRIAYDNGTEELTGWMESEEQLTQTMAGLHTAPGKTYWLQARRVACPDCLDMARQVLTESPITGIPSPRYGPHNSHYLMAVGSRSRYEVFEEVLGTRR